MIGKVVSKGVAISKVKLIKPYEPVGVVKSDNILKELETLEIAFDITINELIKLTHKTRDKIGEEEAQIFEAHQMIMKDPTLKSGIVDRIKKESLKADSAIELNMTEMASMFASMDSEYMQERALDMHDLKKRWIKNTQANTTTDLVTQKVILVAEELTPSETLEMDLSLIAGILMEKGGVTSHTAILAQSMGVPAIVGCGSLFDLLNDQMNLVLDANENRIIIEPSKEEIESYKMIIEAQRHEKERLKSLIGKESISLDGKKIEIAANIAGIEDIQSVLDNDAEGVGLFRTEFVYMNRKQAPSSEEQFKIYKEIVSKMQGKTVIFRTMDIGGDKEVPYIDIGKEYNPFLGYRAIRYCLKEVDFFKTQLRAILMASMFGKVKIMFPMIASIDEFLDAKAIVAQVMQTLDDEEISYDQDIELGIMVEIPSVAIQIKQFAKHVDFFSIGTNDLTQYTLAVDRQNEVIGDLYDYCHPAVLSLIHRVITVSKETGTWVGMCGSAAGDKKLIPLLHYWGIDEISMAPIQVLEARECIVTLDRQQMASISEKVLNADTCKEVRSFL